MCGGSLCDVRSSHPMPLLVPWSPFIYMDVLKPWFGSIAICTTYCFPAVCQHKECAVCQLRCDWRSQVTSSNPEYFSIWQFVCVCVHVHRVPGDFPCGLA